jgi:hypothetical protein
VITHAKRSHPQGEAREEGGRKMVAVALVVVLFALFALPLLVVGVMSR